MAQTVIICLNVFPRPVLHGKLAIAQALFGNIVASIVAQHGYVFTLVKYRAATHGNVKRVVNRFAVQVDTVRNKNLDVRFFGRAFIAQLLCIGDRLMGTNV